MKQEIIKGNNKLIFDTLLASNKPLGAYDILGLLRDSAIKAPPTVYRALEKLVNLGLAHRISSLNSYIVCNHSHSDKKDTISLTVCKKCKSVDEIHDDNLQKALHEISASRKFTVENEVVELIGICHNCSQSESA